MWKYICGKTCLWHKNIIGGLVNDRAPLDSYNALAQKKIEIRLEQLFPTSLFQLTCKFALEGNNGRYNTIFSQLHFLYLIFTLRAFFGNQACDPIYCI